MIDSLSVIFPIYNEEKRLEKNLKKIKKFLIKKYYKKIEIVFVNDGSNDKSLSILKLFKSRNKRFQIVIVNLSKNRGKGFALKTGVHFARCEWILTSDIDLSVPLNQLIDWEKYLKKSIFVYFGSRSHPNSKVKRIFRRFIIGLIFQFIVKILFNYKFMDTQCGFKMYKKNYAKKIFSKLQENGYIHDIEIIQICKKYKINFLDLPVKWTHQNFGKINIYFDSFKMIFALFKLRYKYFFSIH